MKSGVWGSGFGGGGDGDNNNEAKDKQQKLKTKRNENKNVTSKKRIINLDCVKVEANSFTFGLGYLGRTSQQI